ncbi:MAG: hypothetical protein K2F65_04650 [Eubacterium sp.]|nr:hypothetical protein [Eubacterium sp.]
MTENLYGLLTQFSQGTTPSKTRLLRIYSSDLIDYAISKGYILQIGLNSYNEPIYSITLKGKALRDGKGEEK